MNRIYIKYGRFTLCDGIGHYWNHRYEIWEENSMGTSLRFWSSDYNIAINHFEKIKDEPQKKHIMFTEKELEDWINYLDGK